MYRVIIADDEPIERGVVEKIVKKYFADQLEVLIAANGREAIELFEEKDCRIVLLDIEMPGINGLEAAARIRRKDKECSIIFLTAYDEFGYAKKAITVKALDYILKPIEEQELVAALEEAIRIEVERKTVKQDASSAKPAYGNMAEREDAEEKESVDMAVEKLRMNAVAESIRAYIEKWYMEDIALQDVAAAMNYSDSYFCKLFKQCFDKSFVAYLTWFRMEKAKELLGDILINVKDVSVKVGYRDSNYFTKVFKRFVGVTPSEYRLHVLQDGEEQ